MNANRTINFTPPTKDTPEREMRLDRVVVNRSHACEDLYRAVGVFIQQVVQTFQIIRVQTPLRFLFIKLPEASKDITQRRSNEQEPSEKKRRLSRHLALAAAAAC